MFADVILHRRMPAKFDTFTYAAPEGMRLTKGQIVVVPFKKQKLPAVVWNLHSKAPAYPTKTIETALSTGLTKEQIHLAQLMASYYECPLSKIIDFFIPEKIWGDFEEFYKNPPEKSEKKTEKDTAGLRDFIKNLLKTPAKKLVFEKSPLPRPEFYKNIAELATKDSQTLILMPEAFHAQESAPDFPCFHGGLKEAEKAKIWNAIKENKIKTVVGTRLALFLPFANLKTIIFDFEHSESYAEKRAPYYHSLQIAIKLAELHHAKLIIISPTPLVETWHKAQKGYYEKHDWGATPLPKTTIIDMKNERANGNKSLLAEECIQNIAMCMAQDKQVLIFINRTGQAAALLCTDCGQIFKCEKCKTNLAIHEGNILKCHKCKTQIQMPSVCSSCGNAKLKTLGFGTQTVEKELRGIFGKAKILRLEKETKKMNFAEIGKADVIIATQIIDKPIPLPRLELSIAAMPDTLLNFPHFRAQERTLQLLTHVRNLTQSAGKFIIQTFLPENKLFINLQQNSLEKFYEEELATRKMLSLPPFGLN